jgi:hypothetical protein
MDVTNDDSARTKDSEITHSDIRADEYVSAYPSTPPDRYCALDERKVRSSVVVRSGAKMRALGDRCLRANADLPEIIDLNAITNSSLLVNCEIPRNRDPNRTVNTNLATDPGAKESQQPAPQAPQLAWDETQEGLSQFPEEATEQLPARPLGGTSIGSDVEPISHSTVTRENAVIVTA